VSGKSKFAGIFGQADSATADPPPVERVEKTPPSTPLPEPIAASVSRPNSMNFKLSREQSEALALHRFRTGRQKQAIVSEALDMWLAKNKKLVQ
jgi:hypothetical protein